MVEAWVDSDSGFTKGCVSFLYERVIDTRGHFYDRRKRQS